MEFWRGSFGGFVCFELVLSWIFDLVLVGGENNILLLKLNLRERGINGEGNVCVGGVILLN